MNGKDKDDYFYDESFGHATVLMVFQYPLFLSSIITYFSRTQIYTSNAIISNTDRNVEIIEKLWPMEFE